MAEEPVIEIVIRSANERLRAQIKARLTESWLPNREGGYARLIALAAQAAAEVIEATEENVETTSTSGYIDQDTLVARIEFLEGELHAYANPGNEETEADTSETGDATCKGQALSHGPCVLPIGHEGVHQWGPEPEPIDQTKYHCPQCGVQHNRESNVGTAHAHLFYGGQPAGDQGPTAAQRAMDRREEI